MGQHQRRVAFLTFAAVVVVAAHIQSKIRAGTVSARGVNLGGWLVAEQWMTGDSPIWTGVPANISGRGEFSTMAFLGRAAGQAAFDEHRRTWITETHIAQIAAAGLNLVRVPVGYWIQGCVGLPTIQLSNDCAVYATGGLAYLDRLVRDWAVRYNVAVLVNVHGAPGSQNGADHSGPSMDDGAHWSESDDHVRATRAFVVFLATRYRQDDAFLGVGLLNEPAGATDDSVLQQYYVDVYNDVRQGVGSDCILVTSPLLWCQNSRCMQDYGVDRSHVWHDWHPYVVWGYDNQTDAQILANGVGAWANAIRTWTGHPLFLGEWTLVGGAFNTPAGATSLVDAMLAMVNGAAAGWAFWSWRMAGDQTWNRWSLSGLVNAYESLTRFPDWPTAGV
ncbi:Aste57867_25048 [Aphanomyces stellatus]|uniref:glucan 1,3-beta-glucosidase n=1 Tax=Aphanomyces stellatus TaxID=120398 RepID=A0A485LU76_9STRA|nr:hypothetical protein As57867_024970 [Aphanomyces stellatus]VFU01679.1 Aste57867_25048 [Aphanomyces stellatus]